MVRRPPRVLMFLVLTFIMFVGYPVAFVLGGVGAVFFALLGIMLRRLQPGAVRQPAPAHLRPGGAEPGAVAVPMFIFMGTMLEKSGVAEELLKALQVYCAGFPAGLRSSVTLGTIMAATTGIVGASVIMLTLIALPAMLSAATPRSCRSAPSPRPARSAS